MSKECGVTEERNGKRYKCDRPSGHLGDHEAVDGEQGKPGPMKLVLPVPKRHAYAYLMGACDFATGLGLDRLAKELGVPPRKPGEGDWDLSQRARERAKVVK